MYTFSKIFQISSYFEKDAARVLPSLCVTHPYPKTKKLIQSEWISTCAGVFSRKVFLKYKFDKNLKKYSWNEYLDFSYSIYLNNPNSLFMNAKAKYRDVNTAQGRLSFKELIYMAETYDAYIFLKNFKLSFKNVSTYIWSKFGRIIYNILKVLISQPKQTYLLGMTLIIVISNKRLLLIIIKQ